MATLKDVAKRAGVSPASGFPRGLKIRTDIFPYRMTRG